MSPSFNVASFVSQIGERLVNEFKYAASAGTPSLIGGAKEHPARLQLQRLLPGAAAIGSGIVIDSFGNRSKQQDIIVYDRFQCPIFSINETPEATFYPCEGVIAVGEVKSTIGDHELRDSFKKIASAKALQRFSTLTTGIQGPTVAFRSYGSTQALVGTQAESFDQKKPTDQIFGFVLCAKFGLVDNTVHERARELWRLGKPTEVPNLLVALESGFLAPTLRDPQAGFTLPLSLIGADHVTFAKNPGCGFSFLIDRLNYITRFGRSVQVDAFQRYFKTDPDTHENYSDCATLPLATTI